MSPILEVLIGMVFVYSLLSILVTQINAVITNILKLRAKHLRDGIKELVKDDEILAKVLTHPLVDMVENKILLPEQQLDAQHVQSVVNSTLKNVTWIAPENFTSVLLNIIRVDSDQELFGALLHVIDEMPLGEHRRRLRLLVNNIINTGQGIDRLRQYVTSLEDESYREGLTNVLNEIDKEIAVLGFEPDSNISLMAGLRKVKNPYLRSALATILASSKSIEEGEKKIEQWFDNGMSRATTAFQNTMQYWSLLVGILIALVLNIDSIHLAQTLWEDEALRETIITTVERTDVAQLEQIADEAQAQATNSSTDADIEDEPEVDSQGTVEEVEEAAVDVGETLQRISELRLPIGWSFENLGDESEDENFVGSPRYFWNFVPWNYDGWWVLWILKIIGLSATMIAIAQGAPFWFGILQRLSGGSSSKE
jgi:hypothetical protein